MKQNRKWRYKQVALQSVTWPPLGMWKVVRRQRHSISAQTLPSTSRGINWFQWLSFNLSHLFICQTLLWYTVRKENEETLNTGSNKAKKFLIYSSSNIVAKKGAVQNFIKNLTYFFRVVRTWNSREYVPDYGSPRRKKEKVVPISSVHQEVRMWGFINANSNCELPFSFLLIRSRIVFTKM
jgi:hypothetical protein